MRDLGTLGGEMSWAHSIDDQGRIIGWAENRRGQVRPCVWLPGKKVLDIGTLGGRHGFAFACNVSGQVVGEADFTDGYGHAFVLSLKK